MRIPSGDLAPARKHRRYGHRRSRWPVVLAVLVVLGIAAGTYVIRRADTGTGTVTASSRCPSAVPAHAATAPKPARQPVAGAAAVRLPAPGQVALRVFNGTGRNNLARVVGNEVARRGFRVIGMGNAPSALAGPSRVYYGPGGRPAALLVSAHVLGSVVVPVPTAPRGAIDLILGSSFVRLRTAPEASSYARRLISAGAPPAPAKVTAVKPAPSPTCR